MITDLVSAPAAVKGGSNTGLYIFIGLAVAALIGHFGFDCFGIKAKQAANNKANGQ